MFLYDSALKTSPETLQNIENYAFFNTFNSKTYKNLRFCNDSGLQSSPETLKTIEN